MIWDLPSTIVFCGIVVALGLIIYLGYLLLKYQNETKKSHRSRKKSS
jgi:flagellar biogenesis protein FliO